MKWIKRIALGVLSALLLAVLALLLTGHDQVLYGVGKTYLIGKTKPDIDDMPLFDVREIPADHPEPWPLSSRYGTRELPEQWRAQFDSLETTSYLIIHRDSLLFERYYRDGSDTMHTNSFSMAKSFTAILVGKALDEGFITSLDQPVCDFIPEYCEGLSAGLTVRHLLSMTSGIPFGESYSSPFGYMAKAYYGKDLAGVTLKYKASVAPGTLWAYEGGNTVLLSMILERSTGRSVSQYFFEKIWSCIGAESSAYWNLDRKGGMEKAYSGVYATSRDFARIGKLWINDGVWGNDTLVSPSFVAASLMPVGLSDAEGDRCTWYGLHWWLGSHRGMPLYACRGLRGQYIICIPEKDLVIVRTGHMQCTKREKHMPVDMYWYVDAALDIIP